jgi:hypothetical protein
MTDTIEDQLARAFARIEELETRLAACEKQALQNFRAIHYPGSQLGSPNLHIQES